MRPLSLREIPGRSFLLRVLQYVRSSACVISDRLAALLLVMGASPVSAVSRIGLTY